MTTNTLDLIQQIIAIEWSQFSNVQNIGGPANCQSNPSTFCVMRAIQASIWQDWTLKSYLHDLTVANHSNHNMMTEKYARMMAVTHPAEYDSIKNNLPVITTQKKQLVDEIMTFFTYWEIEVINDAGKNNIASFKPESALIYLRNELLTYSMETLQSCLHDVREANDKHSNLVKEIFERTMAYYQSLETPNTNNLHKKGAPCNFNQSNSSGGCGCRSCGIEIPIDNPSSLAEVSAELLDYELPIFYD